MSNNRIVSIDILRGMTVAAMILVNNGLEPSFAILEHAEWNGMTPTDLVFPFFLFIMGVSTYLSLRKYNFEWSRRTVSKIVRRALLLFLIGMAMRWYAKWWNGTQWDLSTLRYFGVLQRIALCYLAAGLFAVAVPHKYTLPTVVVLLVGYTVILLTGNGYVPDINQNIVGRVDLRLFGYDHLYHGNPIDPEGLLSTIPAIAHTLIGFYCGQKLINSLTPNPSHKERGVYASPIENANNKTSVTPSGAETCALFPIGAVLVLLGYLLQFWLPLNKIIWSPSYTLASCGLAALCLALLTHSPLSTLHSPLKKFFLVFGVNPLALFVLSGLLAITFSHIGVNSVVVTFARWLFDMPELQSLTFALFYVLVCWLIGYILYRRHIYIKL